MRKTDCLIDALFLLLYQIISCMVVYFAAWLLVNIISRFIVLEYFAASVIYAVVLTLGVGVLMCIYAYQTAYRSAEFYLNESLLSSGLAIVVHFLIAAVFNYLPLLSGGALHLSAVLSLGEALTSSDELVHIPGVLPPVIFLGLMLIFHSIMLALKKLGANKRLIDRYELTGSL